MPDVAEAKPEEGRQTAGGKSKAHEERRQWFTTPKPIKRLFDRFPLVTYSSNELPRRTAERRNQHALYIFTTEEGAKRDALSFNPGCLKWQVRQFKILTLGDRMLKSSSGLLEIQTYTLCHGSIQQSCLTFRSSTISPSIKFQQSFFCRKRCTACQSHPAVDSGRNLTAQ